jgi:hypothetical protein
MASCIYSKLLPDYGDLDNVSGTAPGYRVYIFENDGGVSVQMMHVDDDPMTASGYAVFMNVEEAKEFQCKLQEAIQRAGTKNANHKARGVDI